MFVSERCPLPSLRRRDAQIKNNTKLSGKNNLRVVPLRGNDPDQVHRVGMPPVAVTSQPNGSPSS
jgi:hypothetical protein